MAYLYHQAPEDMVGETLHPLNELETLAPERYRDQLAKYSDHPSRKRIPYQHISKLNCARHEVLNFSPLHPHLVYEAWQALGVALPRVNWYQLPIGAVVHLPAVLYQPAAERVGDDMSDEVMAWLEPATYRELSALPEETRAWYAELHSQGRRGGWFACTPHVLVRGPVSTGSAALIDWRDKPAR